MTSERGIWKDPTFPKEGWVCYDFDDLGEKQTRKCDACGSTTLRYVHHLRHQDGRTLACGRTCTARLEDDPELARGRETLGMIGLRREPVAKAGRMLHWLKGWQNSIKNDDNIWKRVNGDYATVFLRPDGRYAGVYRDSFTRPYASQVKAQVALYHLTVRPDSETGSQVKVLPVPQGSGDPLPW
jgi:hypothetical protein